MIPFFINLTASLRSEIKGYFPSRTDVCLPQEANAPDPGGLNALDVESSFVLKCYSSSTEGRKQTWSIQQNERKTNKRCLLRIQTDRTGGKYLKETLYHDHSLLFPAHADHVIKLVFELNANDVTIIFCVLACYLVLSPRARDSYISRTPWFIGADRHFMMHSVQLVNSEICSQIVTKFVWMCLKQIYKS